MAKKIGILNFQYSKHNYGAVLQAAALEHELKQQGYNAEHINYIPKGKVSFKGKVKKLLFKSRIIKGRNKDKYSNHEVFEEFRKNFLNRSEKIENEEDFNRLCEGYQAVVVGSDQVWRPKMAPNLPFFFLKYAPNHVQRIAYAVSFGAAEWELDEDDPMTLMAKQEAAKFKAISCRESSGVEICKNVFGVPATHVLDPLLLVEDEFIKTLIKSAKPSSSKIIYYKLGSDEEFKIELAKLEGLYNDKASNIYSQKNNENKYEDVTQWVRNIYDSEVVVSDSFHCICLGLRFGKEVVYYPNPERGQARLDDLFKMFDIQKRKINSDLSSFLLSYGNESVFNEKLNELRKTSIAFITKAIN